MRTPILAAVLLALCMPVMAQSRSEQKETKAAPKDITKQTPREREKQEKERQDRENRLGITPEARQAKLLEHEQYIELRRAELEKKKHATGLTPDEATMLDKMEARKKNLERAKAAPAN